MPLEAEGRKLLFHRVVLTGAGGGFTLRPARSVRATVGAVGRGRSALGLDETNARGVASWPFLPPLLPFPSRPITSAGSVRRSATTRAYIPCSMG